MSRPEEEVPAAGPGFETHLVETESGEDAGEESLAGPAPGRGAVAEEAAPAAGDDELAALRSERDGYLDHLRRLQAEFENYRKRVTRQQADHSDRAAEALVVKLLPVLDTADLAVAHIDPDSEAGKGVAQLAGSLVEVLAKEGLERIDPLGAPFDPNEAEAVMHEPADEAQEAPVVSEVLRAGYRWRGRVARPAMVKVKG